MKFVLAGAIGATLAWMAMVLVYPVYSAYSDRSVSSTILGELDKVRVVVEQKLLKGEAILESTYTLSFKTQALLVRSDGTLIVKAVGHGQVMVLIPIMENGSINWVCIGGSNDAVPPECRGT